MNKKRETKKPDTCKVTLAEELLEQLPLGWCGMIGMAACVVSLTSDGYKNIIPLNNSSSDITYCIDYDGPLVKTWGCVHYFELEIGKPVADLVESDFDMRCNLLEGHDND